MDKLLICIGLKSPISLFFFVGLDSVHAKNKLYPETQFEDVRNFQNSPTNSSCFTIFQRVLINIRLSKKAQYNIF